MKISCILGLFVLTIYILTCCSCSKEKAPKDVILIDTTTLSKSTKGWDLYSWKEGSDWNYTILYGTNRSKTVEEIQFITSSAIQVAKLYSVETLKSFLSKIAPKENIIWHSCLSTSKDFSLPPENVLNEVKDYCKERQLELSLIPCE